jgi:hypothetical protein
VTKKTPAQLDREIATSLSGSYRSKYGHGSAEWQSGYAHGRESTRHETRAEMRAALRGLVASARTDFDRGMVAAYQDALGTPRAHATKTRLRSSRAGSTRSHATKKSGSHDGSHDWEAFTKGAAFAFWASPYISEVENLAEDAREARAAGDARKEASFMAAHRALSPGPGGRWDRVLGDPPPAARAVAKKFTKQVRDSLTDDQLAEVFSTFSAEQAGYKGAMQAQGEGVGWFDEGVRVAPPRGFDFDVKIANAVGRAITRNAREAGAPLPRR